MWIADSETTVTDGGEVTASLGMPARRLFLRTVAEVEPNVLRTLRERVLELYRSALADDRANYLAGRERGFLELYESPLWATCNSALHGWARRWCLTDDWILEAALQTAHSWDYEIRTDSERRLGWLFGRYAFAWRESQRVPLEVTGWEPGEELRRVAERRIRAEALRQVKAYLDQIESLAVNRGYRPLRPSRQRDQHEKIPRQYRWLAEWQVCRTSQGKIAAASRVDSRSVATAIAKLAQEIGLTPRARRS